MDKDKFKLVVKVHTEHEHREEENIDRYTHLENQQGYALLVSFPKNCKGSETDVKSLEVVLKDLKFKTHHCVDPTRDDLVKKLKDTAAHLLKRKFHCFALFITGHGGERGVQTKDDKFINAEDIVSPFKNGFIGKPKLFFIESCRGEEDQKTKRQLSSSDNESFTDELRVPVDADILIAYSTTPGYYSNSSKDDESYFIRECVEVFKNDSSKMHVEEMMLEIRRRIAQMQFVEKEKIYGQMPCTWSTLRKKVFF